MSLFKCEGCGCVENTALCGLVWEPDPSSPPGVFPVKERRKLICSECNPDIGIWHGAFKKIDADEAGYIAIPNTRYIERATQRPQ